MNKIVSVFFLFIFFTLPSYAIHKNVHVVDVDENGVIQRHDKFFGSCVLCEEVISDLVEDIDADENWYCTETDCFYPEKSPTDFDLIIEDPIIWKNDKNLIIHTQRKITFKEGGMITSEKNGSIILKAKSISIDH